MGVGFIQANGKRSVFCRWETVSRIGNYEMTCVMFAPEDLDMIKGNLLCGAVLITKPISSILLLRVAGYYAVLKQRNALLRSINRWQNAGLGYMDEQLAARAIQSLCKGDAVSIECWRKNNMLLLAINPRRY